MKPLFLIGYMGSGKSTLGKALSRMTGSNFIDLDAYIEGRYHKTIKEIFAESGESGFRHLESRMLDEVSLFEDTIISCGGGTPCFGDNMSLMNSRGTTVYLQASVERLFERLSRPRSKAKRPIIANLNDEELRQFISDNIARRDAFYSQASIHFDTTRLESKAEIDITAGALLKQLEGIIKS